MTSDNLRFSTQYWHFPGLYNQNDWKTKAKSAKMQSWKNKMHTGTQETSRKGGKTTLKTEEIEPLYFMLHWHFTTFIGFYNVFSTQNFKIPLTNSEIDFIFYIIFLGPSDCEALSCSLCSLYVNPALQAPRRLMPEVFGADWRIFLRTNTVLRGLPE